jgi:hypothetical protein
MKAVLPSNDLCAGYQDLGDVIMNLPRKRRDLDMCGPAQGTDMHGISTLPTMRAPDDAFARALAQQQSGMLASKRFETTVGPNLRERMEERPSERTNLLRKRE